MPRKTCHCLLRAAKEQRLRFNEAAARCRGKQAAFNQLIWIEPASMRPRPDAAENSVAGAPSIRTHSPLQ